MKTIALLILFLLPAVSAAPGDIVGTVLNVTDSNGLFINVTESKIPGFEGIMQIVLARPVHDLDSFQGKELRFDFLGKDILKRPVCDAYLGETLIQDIPEKIDTRSWFVSDGSPHGEKPFNPHIADFGKEIIDKTPGGILDGSKFKPPAGPWPRVYP